MFYRAVELLKANCVVEAIVAFVKKFSKNTTAGEHLKLLTKPDNNPEEGGGGVLPYIGSIGMSGPKGCGFSAVLGINNVSILAILVSNRVWFFHSSLELYEF